MQSIGFRRKQGLLNTLHACHPSFYSAVVPNGKSAVETGTDSKYIVRKTLMQNNICINILHRIHSSDHDHIARNQPVSRMPSLLTDVI